MKFAVTVCTDLNVVQFWYLVRRNELRAKRKKSIKVLGAGQEARIPLQNVFRGHVQNQAVAGNIIRRLLLRYTVTVAPDDEADLSLGRHALRLRGQLDGVAGPNNGVIAFHE